MKYILIGLVKLYRCTLSKILVPSCRFVPSCSQYAIEALAKHGAVKGGYLALVRIIRCNPFSRGGLDNVPDKFSWKIKQG